MNEKQTAWWQRRRAKGRKHFIWLYGVVLWGLLTGLVWAVAMSAI
jgi:hypothetical protein